jgi:hypothetical protein
MGAQLANARMTAAATVPTLLGIRRARSLMQEYSARTWLGVYTGAAI